MESLCTVLLIAIATWQSVDIWHHSKLLQPVRTSWIAAADRNNRRLFSLLLGCPFCLSIWVGVLYVLLWYTAGTFATIWIAGLAAAKLANFGNDVCKSFHHPPRYEPEADDRTQETDEAENAYRQ